jgi:anti-sigma B factor antagonist
MSVPLQIAERTVGGVVVLQLHGQLVADAGDRILRERVHSLVEEGRTALLLDLGDVSYMDSGGIGTLVEAFTQLRALGGQMKLLHPSWASERVLRITHLTSVFEIFETEEEALRSMGSPAR